MGFAYQAFPRFKHTELKQPSLAYASLWLMAMGVVGRSIAEPLAANVSWLAEVAIYAATLEVIAIILFATIILDTLLRSGKPLAIYDWYIFSSLGWFFIQAVYEITYLAATLSVENRGQLLTLVATWQAPLRDIQIHGFALLMILGVSQRIFHHFYDLPDPDQQKSAVVLVCLNAAILGEVCGLVLARLVGPAWIGLWYLSVLILSGAVTMLLLDWRIFSPTGQGDRSLKFLRTAYVWLLASLAMLVLMPFYHHFLLPLAAPESASVRIGFSHAYYGAVRHAITVGFISLMIVGVAAKVVPTLNGVNPRALSGLWLPFVLLNTGCALRVVTQALTDITPASFAVTGVSGVLEVLGLAIWGMHLWSIMSGRLRATPEADDPSSGEYAALGPDAPILASHRVGEILSRYPQLLETFLAFGFKALTNPMMRRVIAPYVTIERACRLLGVDMGGLLGALNAEKKKQANGRQSLPMVSVN
jgi:hypothetical protein